MKPSFLFCLLLFGLHASGLTAQSRYTILNDTLTLDMTIEEPGYEFDGDLDEYDEDEVLSYLFDNPEVTKLRVTGPGGSMYAANTIAEYLVRHNIDTEAFGICNSACAHIFLGGRTRTLLPDAKLGFHRTWLNKERAKKRYATARVEKGWKDEFDYAEVLYDSAMTSMLYDIKFMLSRGVDLEFILKVFSTDSFDIWHPSRGELIAAGILIE